MQTPTRLKTQTVPLSIVRTTIVGELMKNFGADEANIRTAQQGFAEGVFDRVTVNGLDAAGYIQDQAILWFDELKQDVNISLELSDGRTMIEALNLGMGHAVLYAVQTMHRKGLKPSFVYTYAARIRANPAAVSEVRARYGLTASTDRFAPGTAPVSAPATTPPSEPKTVGQQSSWPPGYGPRKLLSITPSADPGTHLELVTARRIA